MRRPFALAILLLVAACGAPADDATDSTPQDWIEVPLADHVFRDTRKLVGTLHPSDR